MILSSLKDWFRQHFVTVGYFSLVEFTKVEPAPDIISEKCEWVSLNSFPKVILGEKLD